MRYFSVVFPIIIFCLGMAETPGIEGELPVEFTLPNREEIRPKVWLCQRIIDRYSKKKWSRSTSGKDGLSLTIPYKEIELFFFFSPRYGFSVKSQNPGDKNTALALHDHNMDGRVDYILLTRNGIEKRCRTTSIITKLSPIFNEQLAALIEWDTLDLKRQSKYELSYVNDILDELHLNGPR